MDSTVCRDNFARLLGDEVSLLVRLEEMLKVEHDLLVANDVAKLEDATDRRQALIVALIRIEEERQSLCRAHGQSADRSGLEKVLSWCDASGSLRRQWVSSSESAGRCRELNDRNGALVTARLKRVENLLGVLTGTSERPAAYGPGAAYSSQRAGRVLTTAV